MDERGEVNTDAKQKELFLKCSGEFGTWPESSKIHAKTWAASIANIWWDERAQAVQRKFCVDRMMWFLMPLSKAELFTPNIPNVGWHGAIKAAYLSYAGNLPAIADKVLKAHLAQTKHEKFSKNWCIELLKRLTFDPKIAIFLVRYNNIRPALEELYGIELPKTAKSLQEWVPEKIEILHTTEETKSEVIPQETAIEVQTPVEELKLDTIQTLPSTEMTTAQNVDLQTKLTLVDMVISFFKMLLNLFMRKS